MKVENIIGVDISKRILDLACHHQRSHLKVENTLRGFSQAFKWLRHQNIDCTTTLVVMEYTGLYSYQFEQFLYKHSIAFTKVSPLAVKRSMGLVRGKNDKIDALRIARYGYEKQDVLSASAPMDKDLERLQLLYSTRRRLIRQRGGLRSAIKEYHNAGIPQKDLLIQVQVKLINTLNKQLTRLDEEIKLIIQKQKSISNNFNLLKTITGVGNVLAVATIIKTRNFTRFSKVKQFACFCGTAPFENTSGTSYHGRTGVHNFADKEMKSLLDLSAKNAIQYDKELREFYLKRTTNGKSKMSTINIVRNKILFRMFAVVKRQTPFVENYLHAA